MNRIRKIVREFGFDVHRHRPETNRTVWFSEHDIKTIIDVGANVGQFAKEIRDYLPQTHIYSFEPLKECYEKLVTNFNDDKKFQAFNFALGDKNEETMINRSSYSLSSSLLPMSDIHKTAFPHSKYSTLEKIEVKKMDYVFAGENLEKEILIKVDTQGYEDKVIAGGINTFSKAKVLIIETSFVPLYEGQPLFADIYSTLTAMNFIYRGAMRQKLDKKTGEILFEDSCFISNLS